MPNLTNDQLKGWIGRSLVDPSGDKVGKIADIYMDDDTDRSEWLAVTTGLFGSKVSFVPITEATAPAGDDVRSQFYKGQVKEAPNAEADGQLSQDEEARLYTHYGIDYSEQRSNSGLPEGDPAPAPAAATTDDAMTRSEEELEVAKTSREAGRVKLRKWVDVERVETTVPVAHEEVRIERSRSPTATSTKPSRVPRSPKPSTRSSSPRKRPSPTPASSRKSASGPRRTSSPKSSRSPLTCARSASKSRATPHAAKHPLGWAAG